MTTSLACRRAWNTFGSHADFSDPYRYGIGFNLQYDSQITGAYLYALVNSGIARISIWAVDGSYLPTGEELCGDVVDLSTTSKIAGSDSYPVYGVPVTFTPTNLSAGNYALLITTTTGVTDWWTNFRTSGWENGISSCSKNYRYRLYSLDSGGTWYEDAGKYWNFEILGIELPSVTTNAATSVTGGSATLNGTLTSDGGEACDCGFEYGLTDAYGTTTPTQSRTTGQTFSQDIVGLSSGTYHFRAIATNSVGTSYGNDLTFTTALRYFAWII